FDGIHMTAGEHIIKYEFKDAGHFLDAIGFFSDKFEEDEKELIFSKEVGKIDYDGTAEISREEFAHMLMCSYRSLYGELGDTGEISFTDNDTISEEYYQDILEACDAGLLLGDPAGTFRPKDGLTRAEAAVAIRRLLE
ncbi:MAG: S-layer homology domain-containing protein, partial [Clostridia bacterium]|nr:S-layer homology domain-containing protein [Clostridia bacterium]